MAKLQSKSALESSLSELGIPVETSQNKESSSTQPEGKGSKKGKSSKKQRRKSGNKSSIEQSDIESVYSKSEMIPESEDLLDMPSPNSKVGFHCVIHAIFVEIYYDSISFFCS